MLLSCHVRLDSPLHSIQGLYFNTNKLYICVDMLGLKKVCCFHFSNCSTLISLWSHTCLQSHIYWLSVPASARVVSENICKVQIRSLYIFASIIGLKLFNLYTTEQHNGLLVNKNEKCENDITQSLVYLSPLTWAHNKQTGSHSFSTLENAFSLVGNHMTPKNKLELLLLAFQFPHRLKQTK